MSQEETHYPRGTLVWAQETSYCYWPSIVTDCRKSRAYVYFLGYENDSTWIPLNKILPFLGQRQFYQLAQIGQKDFQPSESLEIPHSRAIILAENLLALTTESRLQVFGLNKMENFESGPYAKKIKLDREFDDSEVTIPAKIPKTIRADVENSVVHKIWTQRHSILDTDQFDENDDGFSNRNQFHLGSLVWAKMSGYPFWPSFITLSLDGDYRRVTPKGVEYYCQFFNWKNECAWILNIAPWKEYEEIRSKKKSQSKRKNWFPTGPVANPLKKAIKEAKAVVEKIGISIQEGIRKENLPTGWALGFYNCDLIFESPTGRSFPNLSESVKYLFERSSLLRLKNRSLKNAVTTDDIPRISNKSGWFLNALGEIYNKRVAILHLAGDLLGAVQYLEEERLPSSWTIRMTEGRDNRSTLLYMSKECHGIENSTKLHRLLSGSEHPSAEAEIILLNFVGKSKPQNIEKMITINTKTMDVKKLSKNRLLAKVFMDQSVAMVKMPDEILLFPNLIVTEVGNQTCVIDSVSGNEIASRFIDYD